MGKIERIKVDDPITADFLNQLVDAANSSELTVAQGSGLTLMKGPDGYVLGTTIGLPVWGKTTGAISGGKYPFTLQYPTATGGWTASPFSDTAYEVSGNTSVASGTYAKFWRTSSGDWRFLASSC